MSIRMNAKKEKDKIIEQIKEINDALKELRLGDNYLNFTDDDTSNGRLPLNKVLKEIVISSLDMKKHSLEGELKKLI